MIYSIQFIRFMAALAVFLAHFDPNFGIGIIGVDIFFVLSGFVMIANLHNRDSSTQFLKNRFIRIYPVYIFITSLYLFYLFVTDNHQNLTNTEIMMSLLLIPNYTSEYYVDPLITLGWTLHYEIFFYAIVSFAIIFKERRYLIVAGVISVCCILGFIMGNKFHLINTLMLEFLIGMFLYFIYRLNLPKIPLIIFSILILGTSLFFKIFHYADLSEGSAAIRTMIVYGDSVLHRRFYWGGISAAIIVLILQLEEQFKKQRIWLFLGDLSYMFYLAQYAVIGGFERLGIEFGFYLDLVLVLSFTLLISVILLKLLDQPVRKVFGSR